MFVQAGDVAQWQRGRFACGKSGVRSPASPKQLSNGHVFDSRWVLTMALIAQWQSVRLQLNFSFAAQLSGRAFNCSSSFCVLIICSLGVITFKWSHVLDSRWILANQCKLPFAIIYHYVYVNVNDEDFDFSICWLCLARCMLSLEGHEATFNFKISIIILWSGLQLQLNIQSPMPSILLVLLLDWEEVMLANVYDNKQQHGTSAMVSQFPALVLLNCSRAYSALELG